jgi:RimJ/RimL family protein N-acetyltransferase
MRLFRAHTLRFYRRGCHPVVLLTGDVSWHTVCAADFPWETHPLKEFTGQYRARLADGARALIGTQSGGIVFSAWIASARLHIDELRFTWTIPDGDAVVYDCVTMPDARGRGIYPEALRRLSGMLAEEGVRHLWIYADADNAASLRGIKKADFEYRGSITARIFPGWTCSSGTVKGVNAS